MDFKFPKSGENFNKMFSNENDESDLDVLFVREDQVERKKSFNSLIEALL